MHFMSIKQRFPVWEMAAMVNVPDFIKFKITGDRIHPDFDWLDYWASNAPYDCSNYAKLHAAYIKKSTGILLVTEGARDLFNSKVWSDVDAVTTFNKFIRYIEGKRSDAGFPSIRSIIKHNLGVERLTIAPRQIIPEGLPDHWELEFYLTS